jgi:hypothetical protein
MQQTWTGMQTKSWSSASYQVPWGRAKLTDHPGVAAPPSESKLSLGDVHVMFSPDLKPVEPSQPLQLVVLCRWEPMLGVLAVGLLPQLRNEHINYLCHLVRVLHSTSDYLALVAMLLQVREQPCNAKALQRGRCKAGTIVMGISTGCLSRFVLVM